MLTDGLMKTWDRVHWNRCGKYLDCPLNKPPSFDIPLRDSLERRLTGTGTPKDKPEPITAAVPPENATTKTKKRTKQKEVVAKPDIPVPTFEDEPDHEVTTLSDETAKQIADVYAVNVATTSTGMEPPLKRLRTIFPRTDSPAVFSSPPKRRLMRSMLGPSTPNHSSLDLIVNDSFLRLVQQKRCEP